MNDVVESIAADLAAGRVVPYLGPSVLALSPDAKVPATPEALVALMTAKASVPAKIRTRLTAAAQFIENFKHRKTVVTLMSEAFAATPVPSPLQRTLARLAPPLIVSAWYDDGMRAALAEERDDDWGQVQGLSQSEHFGQWTGAFDATGKAMADVDLHWRTLLYQPIGACAPAANYLVSDSDYVEVLTEIDIQTPIPAPVQMIRAGRSFLFVGCRFNDQLTRSFARQIMKRSSGRHWAVLPEVPTRMEAKFLAEQGIERVAMPLQDFEAALVRLAPSPAARGRESETLHPTHPPVCRNSDKQHAPAPQARTPL